MYVEGVRIWDSYT